MCRWQQLQAAFAFRHSYDRSECCSLRLHPCPRGHQRRQSRSLPIRAGLPRPGQRAVDACASHQQPALGGSDVQHLINVHFTHPAAFAAMSTRPAMLYVPSAPVSVPGPRRACARCISTRVRYFVFNPDVIAVLVNHDLALGEYSSPTQLTSQQPPPRLPSVHPRSASPPHACAPASRIRASRGTLWYSRACRASHLIDVKVRPSSPMH